MRLKKEHIESIKELARKIFGEETQVYLFGSRVNNNKKGGDIDLYIETTTKEDLFEKKIQMILALYKIIGEQKIDLIINDFSKDKLIYKVAKKEGVLL